jgi:hypothetical protein
LKFCSVDGVPTNWLNPVRPALDAITVGAMIAAGVTSAQVAPTRISSISIFPRHGSIYQFFGAGVVQTVGKGKLSAYYVPNMTTTLLNDIGHDATAAGANQVSTARKGSAYEIGYRGDLGVSGLQAKAFITSGDRVDMNVSANKEVKTRNYGLAYTTGAVTLSGTDVNTALGYTAADAAVVGDINAALIAING